MSNNPVNQTVTGNNQEEEDAFFSTFVPKTKVADDSPLAVDEDAFFSNFTGKAEPFDMSIEAKTIRRDELRTELLDIQHDDEKADRVLQIEQELTQMSMPSGQEPEFYEMVADESQGMHQAYAPWELFMGIGTGQTLIKLGVSTVKGAVTRGAIIGAAATATDVPLHMGISASGLAEEHPWVAIALELGLSLPIGKFADANIERGVYWSILKTSPGFFSKNLDVLIPKNSKNISDVVKQRAEFLLSKADEGDYVALKEAQELLKRDYYHKNNVAMDLANYHVAKEVAEPGRKAVNQSLLKKSFKDLTDKDMSDIQALAEADTIVTFSKEFDKLKNKIHKRLAADTLATHPILELSQEVAKDGGFNRSVIERFVGKEATDVLAKRFPNILREGDGPFVNPIHKAVAWNYDSVEEMLYDVAQMKTVPQIQAGITRANAYDWNLLYMAELSARMSTKELSFWRKMGAKRLIDQTKKNLEVELKEIGTPPKRIKSIMGEVDYIRNVAKRMVTTLGKTRKIEKRVEALQRASIYKRSIKLNRELTKLNGKLNNVLRSKGVPADFHSQMLKFMLPYIKSPKGFEPPPKSMTEFMDEKILEGNSVMALIKKRHEDILLLPVTVSKREDLTVQQWRQIVSLQTDLAKLGRIDKKLTTATGERVIKDLTLPIQETADNTFKREMLKRTQREEFQREPTKLEKYREHIADTRSRWLAELKRPEFILDELGGFKDFSEAYRLFETAKIMEDTQNAIATVLGDRWQVITKALAKATGKRLTNKFWKEMFEDSMGYFKTSRERMLAMAAMTGNDHNFKAMQVSLGKDGTPMADILINRFLRENMTDADWAFVKDLWKMTDEMHGMLAKVYQRMTGYTLPKVKNYFPIIPDYKWTKTDRPKDVLEDVFLNMPNYQHLPTNIQKRFFRQRRGGTDAIRIDFDAFAKHIRDVSHTVSHWEGTTDLQKIIKDSHFTAAVVDNLGKNKYKVLQQWADDLIQPSPTDAPTWQRIRANVTVANLGLKVTAAVVQPLSMLSAIPHVGAENLVGALSQMTLHPRQTIRTINELSSQMTSRSSSWQRDLGEAMEITARGQFKGNKMLSRNGFFMLIRAGDILGSYTTWYAGYMKGMQNYSGDVNKAVRVADKAVRKTQPQSALKDLPNIMKGPEWKRFLSMFYAYYSVLHNQSAEIFRSFKYSDTTFGEVVSAVHWMYIAPPIAASIIKERKFDEDKMMKYAASHAAGGFPLVRDLVSGVAMGYDYTPTPVADVGKQLVNVGKQLVGKVADEEGYYDDDWTSSDITPTVKLLGYGLGLPTGQVMTAVRAHLAEMNGQDVDALDYLLKLRREED